MLVREQVGRTGYRVGSMTAARVWQQQRRHAAMAFSMKRSFAHEHRLRSSPTSLPPCLPASQPSYNLRFLLVSSSSPPLWGLRGLCQKKIKKRKKRFNALTRPSTALKSLGAPVLAWTSTIRVSLLSIDSSIAASTVVPDLDSP